MSSPERTDEQLMAAYVAGDSAAFGELFDRYGPALVRYFRARGVGSDLAKDLVQQTFLHVHRARADFRLDARFRPWMYTIALNALRHHFRRRKRKPEVELKDAHLDAGPSTTARAPTLSRLELERLLSKLPDAQRDVLVMFWLQDLSFAEIGEALGIKEGAARVRAHRAYARLRELLGVEGGEGG